MKLDRRAFLGAGLAAGTLFSGAWLTSCRGIRHTDGPDAQAADRAIAGLGPRRRSILHYASLAPSGHNSQPWQIAVVAPNQWLICADPDRRLPAVDPDNRELFLSIGAFAENLALAAGVLGLRAEMQVVAQTSADRDIIRVGLKESAVHDYPLERLAGRMTVRHGYLAREIKKADIAALGRHLTGRLFYFPRGTTHARCIEEGVVENFKRQASRDDAQRELVRWLRLRDVDAKRHRDGLTPESMELRGFRGWLVRNFSKSEDFLRPGFRRQGIELTATLARQGGGWLVVTSEGDTVADRIDTGRRFQRLALMARERQIAIHPMMQSLEEKQGRRQIAAAHTADIHPQLLLRVGYLSAYPDPVSLRRPVSWFVKSA